MRSRRRFTLITVAAALAFVALQLIAQAHFKKLHAYLAVQKTDKPTTTFSPEVPMICAFWKGEGLVVGDKLKAVWIAEEIAGAAAKNDTIRQGEMTVLRPGEGGDFTLSRPPDKTWPVGRYALLIFLNGRPVESLEFTIEPGAKIEVH